MTAAFATFWLEQQTHNAQSGPISDGRLKGGAEVPYSHPLFLKRQNRMPQTQAISISATG